MATVNRVTKVKAVPTEREHMQLLLLQNPNYFGTLAKSNPLTKEFKAVKAINGNTTYEQLTCVGYNPQMKTLTAIIRINKENGYSGSACSNGSKEYVRFYIDYQRNGNWEDLGMISFDAHNFDLNDQAPLCYAVNLAFEPEQTRCCDEGAVLPAVKAILSWNNAPAENDPNFVPIWGNIVDVNIQLAPKTGWICWLKKNFLELDLIVKPEQLEILAQKMPTQLPEVLNIKTEEASLKALTKIYKKEVAQERIGFTTVAKAISAGTPTINLTNELKAAKFDLSKVIDFVLKPKFNTTYEEVKCVGLNRDTDRLYATITMKRPYGYSGSLCDKGSREYVAFYMDFGSGWEHMGTSSVEVHDIRSVPNGGLCYHVELPVNLTPHQKLHCSETLFAKVKAILSWNMMPPANEPDWIAPWGDWEQAWVEIRHRRGTYTPDGKNPIITTIGSIAVEKVNKITGMVDKTLGTADASIDRYDGFGFNGQIPITGSIPEHPDSNNIPGAQMKYRIMLKRASQPDSNFAPVTNDFKILKNVISGGILDQDIITQSPDSAGFYNYRVDFFNPTIVTVHGDLFGVISVADSDVYEFYIETDTGFISERCRVKVDKNAPKDVHITVDGSEDCGTLIKGMDISGTYSLDDEENNCDSVMFQFISLHSGDSTVFKVDSSNSNFGVQIPVAANGVSGTWSMTTNNVRKCGYNIRLLAYDKTLLCYPFVSYAYTFRQQRSVDTIGFCLNEG